MKKTIQSLSILGALFLSLFLQFCQAPSESSTQSVAVQPPLLNVNVPSQTFEVIAEEGKTISLPNGTKLIVPANAFVDAEGNPVRGKVRLKYREFHNAADIIASGITMRYDSAGTTHHFSTAGMFELQGFQRTADKAQVLPTGDSGEEPVFIAPDQRIEVQMASFAEGDNYNFYELDQENGNWAYRGYSKAVPNEAKIAALDAIAPLPAKPLEPTMATSDMEVFDVQFNRKKYPEFAEFEGILWKYVGEPANSPHNAENKWIFEATWENLVLTPSDEIDGQYEINFTANGKPISLEAVPVFSGAKNQKKALKKFKKKMEAYQAALQKRQAEAERKRAEANLTRAFQISNFGIYNHDRLVNVSSAITLKASFKANDQALNDVKIFLITDGGRGIIEYRANELQNFRFDPKADNRLLAILPNSQVGTYSAAQFEELEVKNGEAFTFNLNRVDNVNSFTDLQNVLAQI